MRCPGRSQWPIIRAVNKARQRSALALLCASVALGALTGCQARSSIEAAQTAVVAVQTALPSVQAPVPGLEALLAGASIDVNVSPRDAAPDAVSEVTIHGTDSLGTLGQLDERAREAAASAAVLAVSRYYPNANVSLTIVDTSGAVLVSARAAAGQPPSVQ